MGASNIQIVITVILFTIVCIALGWQIKDIWDTCKKIFNEDKNKPTRLQHIDKKV